MILNQVNYFIPDRVEYDVKLLVTSSYLGFNKVP